MRLTNLQSANALPNTRGFGDKRLKMSKESSYVFMLRAGGSELEVVYNEQNDQVYLSEAQLFLKGDHVEGGCLFFIDEVYDMDKLISYLSEIREKMVKHYAAKPDIAVSGCSKHNVEITAVYCQHPGCGEYALNDVNYCLKHDLKGPYCTECGKPQTKEEIGARISLCFDCEKKQIIQSADSFKPVVCMICEGRFDNSLQRQVGICGTCQKKAEAGQDAACVAHKICTHKHCGNTVEEGFTLCYIHLKPVIKDVD